MHFVVISFRCYILSSICINLLFDFFAVSYFQELAALKRSDGKFLTKILLTV